MRNTKKIPAVAVLGLSFTGCGAEGIVGEWRATELDGKMLPAVVMEGEAKKISEGFLEIGDDFKGDLRIRTRTEAASYAKFYGYSVDIEVEEIDGVYVVSAVGDYFGEELEDSEVLFLCDVNGDSLTCSAPKDGETSARFVREN